MVQKYFIFAKFDKALTFPLIVPDDFAGSLFYTNHSSILAVPEISEWKTLYNPKYCL